MDVGDRRKIDSDLVANVEDYLGYLAMVEEFGFAGTTISGFAGIGKDDQLNFLQWIRNGKE